MMRCDSDWTIGSPEAVRNVREEFGLSLGAIKLNRTSFDADQTFAEEMRRMTGEGIETLQFDGDKIISQERQGREFIFTFVNGEKEFNFMISIYLSFLSLGISTQQAQSPPAGKTLFIFCRYSTR
jgi:hypothetical protein